MKKTITLFYVLIFASFMAKSQNFSVTSGSLGSSTIRACDSTLATITTFLGCINWTMGPSSFAVSGNTIDIRVDYTSSFICAGAISNPVFTEMLSNLTAGTYNVNATAFLDNVRGNSVGMGTLTVNSCIISGIENSDNETDLEVYPNPAKDFVTVDNFTGKQLRYQVFDIGGREVISGVAKAKTNTLDVRNLDSGIYFLKYQLKNQALVQKLIVR